MAQITKIGAGIYTQLGWVANPNGAATSDADAFAALTYVEVTNVRDFPTFGTPANIVNVPTYGQAQSSQVAGQVDAPTLEFTINYIPGDTQHAALELAANTSTEYAFRIRLANEALPDTVLSTTEHSDFFIRGQIASFTVTPSLTDANTATLTLVTAGDFHGPYTTPSS